MTQDIGRVGKADQAAHASHGAAGASPPSGEHPSRRLDLASLSVWPERRPPRTEAERHEIAERFSAHLPDDRHVRVLCDGDILAMRAAFIKRFDEPLPRTETLFAVARIGYRMALRDAVEDEGAAIAQKGVA